VQYAPSDSAYYNLGTAYNELSKWSEAIDAFSESVKLRPSYQGYANLSLAYFKIGKSDDAINCSIKAIEMKGNDEGLYLNLGYQYAVLKHWPEAIVAFRRAISLRPDFSSAHYELGLAYFYTGDRQLAMEEYSILMKIDKMMAIRLMDNIK
jgi:tetratricopeptide (TPR) repeat protein